MVWIKNLTKLRSSFTVIFRSKFGIHTVFIGSRNITTTTIELLKNVIYMTSNFAILMNLSILLPWRSLRAKLISSYCVLANFSPHISHKPYIYICLSISIYISISLSLYLSISLSISLSLYLSISLSIYLSIYLYIVQYIYNQQMFYCINIYIWFSWI